MNKNEPPRWIRNVMPSSHGRSRILMFRDAARSGDLQSLEKSFEAGGIFRRFRHTSRVDVNDRRFPSHTTALMDAAAGGHQNVVEYLLSKKADVRIGDIKGRTALHYAVFAESESATLPVHNPLVHALMIAGVDVDASDWNDVTALDLAFSRNNVSAAYTLSSAGATPRSASNSGNPEKACAASEHIMESETTRDSVGESIREVQVESANLETYPFLADSSERSFLVGECYAQTQVRATSTSKAAVETARAARPTRQRRKLKTSLPQTAEIQTKLSG